MKNEKHNLTMVAVELSGYSWRCVISEGGKPIFTWHGSAYNKEQAKDFAWRAYERGVEG